MWSNNLWGRGDFVSVTTAADALILAATIAASIDNIDVLSVQDAGGEIIRVAPQTTTVVSATENRYEFYLTENEGNGDLIGMSLYGNGATVTLGTGTEMVTQVVAITKTNTQSLLIHWNVKVVV
jgi:hypothetical protein